MSRTVIVHPEMGVLVEARLGSPYWSKEDTRGRDTVLSFEDEAGAREFLDCLDGDHSEGVAFHAVDADGEDVTIDELRDAGLEEHLGGLVDSHRAP